MAITESALVLGACLLFLFGILEYGRFVGVRQLMTSAAREGARYAVVHTYDKTTADVQNVVQDRLGGLDKQLTGVVTIDVYKSDVNGNNLGAWTDAGFGEYVGVSISGSYSPWVPNLLSESSSFNVKVTAVMYSEAN